MTTTPRRTITDVNHDLDVTRRSIQTTIDEMVRLAGAAPNGELSGGTLTRYNDLERHLAKEDARKLDLEAERDTLMATRSEALGAVRTAAGLGQTEHGDGAAITRNAPIPGMHRRNGGADPWLERDAPSYGLDGTNLRSAALDAVERSEYIADDDTKQRVTEFVESVDTGHVDPNNMGARWAVAMTDPAYVRAFYKAVRNPMQLGLLLDEDERAAMRRAFEFDALDRSAMAEAVTTTGGFLVPAHLDSAFILTNGRVPGPIRQIARKVQIATQTWKGIASSGVTASWAAEAAEVADASPTVAQPSITPVRWDAYVQVSFEMLDDTSIANEIGMLMADARMKLEADGFVTGTGSTQPWGVITRIAATTASRVAGSSGAAGAATLVLDDIYALDNAMLAAHRRNASWLAEKSILNKVRRFGEGSNGTAANIWTDLGDGLPSRLLGYPAYDTDAMDSTIVSGSSDDILLLGDFKKYYIVDHVVERLAFDPMVHGANRRPTGEVGWLAMGRTGADVVDTGAFRLLRL